MQLMRFLLIISLLAAVCSSEELTLRSEPVLLVVFPDILALPEGDFIKVIYSKPEQLTLTCDGIAISTNRIQSNEKPITTLYSAYGLEQCDNVYFVDEFGGVQWQSE